MSANVVIVRIIPPEGEKEAARDRLEKLRQAADLQSQQESHPASHDIPSE